MSSEADGGNGVSPQSEKRWWEKVLDKKEAKNQVLFSLPIILTTVFYYLITLVSVMFAGHLAELELAGATLANSWAIVTGFGLMTGLSGALETLCGQSFGAAKFRMLGIYLQGSCIISLFFSVIVSVIWIYTEPILILLHQDRHIAIKAALYIKYLIPGLFAYGFLQNILRFLQTQSVVVPLAVLSFIPLCMHIGLAYCMINLTALKFKGAPIAASISLWISFLMLFLYVFCGKKFKKTWNGVSLESFRYILTNMKLALPSAAMVCLEYWAFEILVFLAGLMPNPKISTSLIAIWYLWLCPLPFSPSSLYMQHTVAFAVLSFIPLCMHIGLAYCMIHLTALKFKGAPIAASISLWISFLMLFLYVFCGKKFKKTWNGVSLESFRYILTNLKLALPSAAMVCLEYWAFKILVFLAGLMPNPKISTSLIAICINTEVVAFMLIYGLSAAASTRVSNELGAGNVDRAKKAMVVTLKLSVLLDLAMVLAIVFAHNIWAGFFSDSHPIKKEFASLTPFLPSSFDHI